MVQIRKKELEVIERSLRDGIELASGSKNYLKMPNSPIVIRYKRMLNALEIVKELQNKLRIESYQILLNETDCIDP